MYAGKEMLIPYNGKQVEKLGEGSTPSGHMTAGGPDYGHNQTIGNDDEISGSKVNKLTSMMLNQSFHSDGQIDYKRESIKYLSMTNGDVESAFNKYSQD